MAVTKKQLESQLKNAKNKASNARDKLTLEMSFNRNKGLPEKSGAAYEAANAAFEAAGKEVGRLEKAVTNFKEVEKKKTPKQIADEEERLRQEDIAAGRDPVAEAAKRKEVVVKEQAKTEQKAAQATLRDYQTELAGATNTVAKLSETERKALAGQLNKIYGLKLPEDGLWSQKLSDAYTKAISDNLSRSIAFNEEIPLKDFLLIAEKEGTYRPGAGAGTVPTINVSDPTEAAGYVRSVFKSVLQRDPTAAEISKYSKVLQTAEKNSPKKTVNGVTTGGLGNPLEFLTVEIQKLPEFAKKKTDKVTLTTQSILGTAKANGISLNQTQIDSFAKRVQDGTDIKIIDNEIRGIAGLGMPEKVQKLLAQGIDLDTVYSPYKNLMASILELNPESIDLKDPTLRSAIGPDKEMPIYDFEKNLRKDYRWQYTDNAKRDVSNVALKVLRDFGFQA
jgi:hypothetical protein